MLFRSEASILGSENPYLDKNDIIPLDPEKKIPPRPREVRDQLQVSQYISKNFPHPDPEWAAVNQKCEVVFRKYVNNIITFEVIGPVSTRAVGVRVNKFGKTVPEKYEWVDPRTGEQIIRNEKGMLTPIGTRLKSFMQRQKVNKSTAWDAWIDREFIINGSEATIDNPWS